MVYQSLWQLIETFKREDELIIIEKPVEPELEVSEITDRLSKSENNNKAILFNNNGTSFPLLMNMMGSHRRVCMALGLISLDEIAERINILLRQFNKISTRSFFAKIIFSLKNRKLFFLMPKVIKRKTYCQEVIHNDPDINIFPIIKCWPKDGGRFITLPVVHTRDPETGQRNIGMYRMQVFDSKTTGMHWHMHKEGAAHYEKYKAKGEKMPLAVILGGDPAYTYAATAPLPEGIDEYLFAGFLRKKRVRMVKCITQDIEVPSDADIVIEGYVDPNEPLRWEGPFGDHTGYYSKPDFYPAFHITCITHRKNAVYPATLVGIPPQEDFYFAKATERFFMPVIRHTIIPELINMDIPAAGVGHNIVIVKINKRYPGQAIKVKNALWGAGQMMFNKILLIIDQNFIYQDYFSLVKKLFNYFDPQKDVYISRGPLDILDHSTEQKGYGGKMCVDATIDFEEEKSYFYSDRYSGKFINVRSNHDINDALILDLSKTYGIPVLLVGLNNSLPENYLSLIMDNPEYENIKAIVFIDKNICGLPFNNIVWIASNNLNPDKGAYISKNKLILDCITKYHKIDGFEGEWPEITKSSKPVIIKVDKRWKDYNIGEFIESPSAIIMKNIGIE